MTPDSARRTLRASLGPGLMWAAAAIGVSHLVQSTRAGALGGLSLAGIILLALLVKYPFFDYGPRFAAATEQSLVEGYRSIGRWAVWLYLLITVSTAVIVQTAVVLFTSSLFLRVFGLAWPIWIVAALICLVCAALILVGRFKVFDVAVKAILVVLAISTVTAAAVAAPQLDLGSLALVPRTADGAFVSFAFLLALAGWMPSPIDLSVWSSLWTLAKDRELGYRSEMRHVMMDFRIGYIGTGITAAAFLILGTVTMYQTGATFSPQGTTFAGQVVDLYAATLGEWTLPIVYAAVLSTMFSTSLTVIEGYPRALERTVAVLRQPTAGQQERHGGRPGPVYLWVLVALGIATVVVHATFLGAMTTLVDVATIVTFLTAPALGYLNLRAVTLPSFPAEARPGRGLLALSYGGLVVLGGVAIVFLITRIF
ncbi:MAG: divalent metal cation transporter [Gemmatimonadota bacterium]|nr:divalent metal cation transporter [Gemmatimonadota bacterium]